MPTSDCPEPKTLGRLRSNCPVMHRLFAQIESLARSHASVLLWGATGTGKTALAQELHNAAHRGRDAAPLGTLICSGLSACQLDSQLGAMVPWGAPVLDRRRPPGGTVVLQDVSALDAAAQAVLLRLLSGQPSVEEKDSNPRARVRWIALSRRDLRELVRQGRFRPELYYRLAAVALEVPPLCERRADVPILAAESLRISAAAHTLPVPEVDPAALELLSSYSWPGNVRELQHVLQAALLSARGQAMLLARDVAKFLGQAEASASIEIPAGTPLAQAERLILMQTLAAHGGRRAACAETLGISRRTLYAKLQSYRDADRTERAARGQPDCRP